MKELYRNKLITMYKRATNLNAFGLSGLLSGQGVSEWAYHVDEGPYQTTISQSLGILTGSIARHECSDYA